MNLNKLNLTSLSLLHRIPKGRCIDCAEFIEDNPGPKKCHCKAKPGYITHNALDELACEDFKPKQKEEE